MMKVTRNGKAWALVVAATALTAQLSAQQPAAPASTTVAPSQVPAITPYVVGQAVPPPKPGFPVVDMSLDRAIQIALESNLDLKAARLSPQLADYTLQSARASFLARYTTSYTLNNSTSPSNDRTEGDTSTVRDVQSFQGQMNQTTPWHGLSYTAGFTSGRTSTSDAKVLLNPSLTSGLTFSATQPLLAGFRIDATRNTLRTASIAREVADLTLQTTIEDTKANVRTAYWNLRQAIEQIEIAKQSLDLAQRTYDDNNVRVQIGSMAPIGLYQNQVGIANANQTLVAAQNNWEITQQAFIRLLANGPADPLYHQTVNPTEQPLLTVLNVDIPSAVQTALSQRLDVVTSRRNIESSKLSLEVTQDQLKPNLSLTGGINSSGQGGDTIQGGVITNPGGYWDALHALAGWNTSGWNLGVNLTLPYGQQMTNNRINFARAQIQLEQQQDTLQTQELTVTSDVTTAAYTVSNSYKQYQASVTAREAQERNAEASQTQFSVGTATNFEVVTAQNDLTQARLTELNAIIRYVNAVADFDRIQKVGR